MNEPEKVSGEAYYKLQEENKRLKKELENCYEIVKRREIDPLTGLLFKESFFAVTRHMLDKKHEKKFVFVRFDIGKFQLINSFFGFEEGDRLLQYFAQQLKITSEFSTECVLGHIDADIFCCCYEIQTDLDYFLDFISKSIDKIVKGYRSDYKLVISAGIYVIEENSVSLESIYSKSILATKKCKETTDFCYTIYCKTMSDTIIKNQRITNEMNKSLQNEEFTIWLQPKCNLSDGRIIGAEALGRWMHPVMGILSPGEFIPIFENNGFISKLDKYIWEKTCEYIRGWIDSGIEPIPLSVNVSRIDLLNPNIAEIFAALLKKYEISPDYLHLEITESAYSENSSQIIKAIKELKALGLHLEMDDFGTGYSSLNMLNELPLDTLKLDMRFIQSKEKLHNNGSILSFIINLAKHLNLFVIAEGIETEEQIIFLRSIGCHFGQGYFFSKPIPKNEFDVYLKKSKRVLVSMSEIDSNTFLDLDDVWFPNSKFNFLFDNFVGALGIFDINIVNNAIKIIRANTEYFEMFNLSQEKFNYFKDDVGKIVHSDDMHILTDIIAKIWHTGKKEKIECRITVDFVNNPPIWLWVKIATKLAFKNNESMLILASLEDITVEKEAIKNLEEAIDIQDDLKKELVFFRSTGMNSILSCRLDEDFTFVYANDYFFDLLEITKEYAIEHAKTIITEIIHPNDLEKMQKNPQELIISGKDLFKWQIRVITRTGKIKNIFSTGRIMKDEIGYYFVTVVTDETDIIALYE